MRILVMQVQTTMRWLIALSLAGACALAQRQTVTIGVVLDGPGDRSVKGLELIQQEITSLLSGEYDVRFPPEKRLDGNWNGAQVRAALDQLLADPEVDVVLAAAAVGSIDAARRGPLPKPVLTTGMLLPRVLGLPYEERLRPVSGHEVPQRYYVSGVENLSYTVFSTDFVRELSAFREVVPFTRLAVISMEHIRGVIPDIEQIFNREVAKLNLQVTHVWLRDSVTDALARIPADTEAVYVTPLMNLSDAEFQQLVQGLIDRRLPSFSLWGRGEVVQGIMASLAVERDFTRTARRTALNLHRILLGEPAAELPVGMEQRERLALNIPTSRAVGVYPSWAVLTEAELIGEPERENARRLSLGAVIREAEQVNLDLAAANRSVEAGEQTVRMARSSLLPQLEISAQQVVIDKDRAEASFGSAGQFQTSGSIGVSQLIYSENARANYDIETRLQGSREQDRARLRLDVVLEAAQDYLNVLRASTFERIQRENLERTRSNLELAVSRRDVGSAGPGEIYRWEVEIANNRLDLIAAAAQRNQAEIALNRVLNRPSEEAFLTEESGVDDSELSWNYEKLTPFIGNQQTFRLFRRFMAARAIELSPEIRQLNAAISAQERALLASKRAFYVPTVGAQAQLTGIENSGAGSGATAIEGLPPDLMFPRANGLDWNIAINASLPVFNGGALRAQRARTQIELDEITLQREATRQRVEQRVRSAMHEALASWAAIDLSRQAAAAARNNFDLVSDAYAEGVVEIIRVVDAQNQALVAELMAANAVYDFLIDLMSLQRGIGEFDYFRTPEQRRALLEELEKFYEDEGFPVRKP